MKTLTKIFITLTAALTIHTAAATENTTVPPAEPPVATTQVAVTSLQRTPAPSNEAKSSAKAHERRLPVSNLMTLMLLGFCGYVSYLIIQPLFKKKNFDF